MFLQRLGGRKELHDLFVIARLGDARFGKGVRCAFAVPIELEPGKVEALPVGQLAQRDVLQ